MASLRSAAGIGVALAVMAGGGHKAVAPVIAHLTGAQPGSVSATAALGQAMAANRGWTGGQWQCLNWLWTRESGWRTVVWNYQGSGAYGIPQALPASKMASAGPDYMTNPRTQIRWGLGYIATTYGTPCGAWAHETSHGWY